MKKILLIAIFITNATLFANSEKLLFEDDFQSGLSSSWRVLKAEGSFTPRVVGKKLKKLRLTNKKHDESTATTLDYEFPTKNNQFVLEFDYFAYGGCKDGENYTSEKGAGKWGADGTAIILYDSSAGKSPSVGASGGSLGYANGTIIMSDNTHSNQPGFEKGWLGIGLDEFGCFAVNDEDRKDIDGNTDSKDDVEGNEIPNTIAIRGDASHGYRLLANKSVKKSLARKLSTGKNSYKSGHYRLTVDSTKDEHLYITLERDGQTIISRFDAMESRYHMGEKPEKFRLAFSSGTGGGCNNHEIDNVKIYSKGSVYIDEKPEPFTCDSESFVSWNEGGWAGADASHLDTISLLDGKRKHAGNASGVNGVNSIGYNIQDNMLWGWNIGEEKVVRIDANKNATLYDIAGIKKRFYVAADVTKDGILCLFSRESSSERKTIVRVDLNTLKLLPEVTLDKEINTADFAFNVNDNKLYFIQAGTDDLYTITFDDSFFSNFFNSNIRGKVEKVADLGLSSVDPIINFFDKAGNFYFNKDSNNMYKFDVTHKTATSKATWFSTLEKTLSNGDGARCANAEVVEKPSEPFTCSQDAYLFSGGAHARNAHTINLSTGEYALEKDKLDYQINAAGYNVKDKMIWGYDINTHKVIKIDANYIITSYDLPELPKKAFYAGDVSLDGILYLKHHDNKNIYKINLNSGTPVYDGKITLSKSNLPMNILYKGENFGDFAFNPVDDMLYSISENDGHLYRINPSNGKLEDLGKQMEKDAVKFHTFVFDKSGNLYFYGSEGKIYKIYLGADAPATYNYSLFAQTDIKSGGGDGARCANAEVPEKPLEPFTCDDTMYFSNDAKLGISGGEDASKMWLHKINREQTPFRFDAIGEPFKKSDTDVKELYNALAYNPADNFLYAVMKNHLVKIDKKGKVKDLGIIDGLPNDRYFAGTFGKKFKQDGKEKAYYYLTMMNKKTIYKIDVESLKVSEKIKAKEVVWAVDMTIDKSGDYIYYINRKDGAGLVWGEPGDNQLSRVKIKGNDIGKVEHIGENIKGSIADTIFYDANDKIYVLYHKDGFYEIDKDTGKRTAISNAPVTAGLNDGAMCPNATVSFKPIISIADVKKEEGDSGVDNMVFTLYISGKNPNNVTYHFKTEDIDAKAGEDYKSVDANGMGSIINVPIKGDTEVESDEKFKLVLSNIQGALYHDSTLEAKGTIIDDDHVGLIAYTDIININNENKKVIKTQIVNRDFNLTFEVVNPDGSVATNLDDINSTKYKFVESASCQSGKVENFDTNGFLHLSLSSTVQTKQHQNISYASKEQKVQLYWRDKKGNVYVGCSDVFAVRPKKYSLEVPEIVAGKDFNITVKALDFQGDVVANYEESAAVYDLNVTETGQGCSLAESFVPTKVDFKNGKALIPTRYPDIGKLRFAVKEIRGNDTEYAKTDALDGSGESRFIERSNVVEKGAMPAKIMLQWNLQNGDNSYTYYNDFLEYSDGDAMSAKLDLQVKVHNAQNQPVRNFDSSCELSTDIVVKLGVDIESSTPLPPLVTRYSDINSSSTTVIDTTHETIAQFHLPSNGIVDYRVDKRFFHGGKAHKLTEFNFDRNASVALNPMKMRIHEVNATLGSLSERKSNDKSVTFLYTRAHIPDQDFIGEKGDAKVFYEVYCKDCNRAAYGIEDLKESVDAVYWYRLKQISESYFNFNDDNNDDLNALNGVKTDAPVYAQEKAEIRNLQNEGNKGKKLSIQVGKSPFSARVKYKPKSYLVFNPFNPNATTHSFTAEFAPPSAKWGGKGNTGYTVDCNVSSRNNFNIIDW